MLIAFNTTLLKYRGKKTKTFVLPYASMSYVHAIIQMTKKQSLMKIASNASVMALTQIGKTSDNKTMGPKRLVQGPWT